MRKHNTIKYLAIGLFTLTSYVAIAQPGGNPVNKNAFLNQSFWQNKPGLDDIKTAIANGNDPAELNGMAMDPVVLAINSDAPKESIIYLLEQKGNNVEKLTHDSRTYIFWAAMRGNLDIIQYLISKGASVKTQDSHGMTPMSFAAILGQQNIKIYDLLLQNGENLKTDVNADGANVLMLAIGGDSSLALTEYLQAKGLNLNSKDADGNTTFDYAAKGGNIKAMKLLREKKIPFTNNAMMWAAQGSRSGANGLDVFQYLEGIGIKPTVISKNGENALHSLARRGKKDIVEYFLSKGVDVNQKDKEGNTPFMIAAASNQNPDIIGLLLPKVKNINEKNNAGATALALAVRGNSAQVVQAILNAGADVNTVDNSGNNLVSYLFEYYNPRQAKEFQPKVKALQDKGFAITTPSQNGNTLYHLVVAKNDLNLVKMVHDNYATVDINTKNKEGLTALQKAAMVAKDDVILKYLIANGADKQLKTNFDETAFDLASENELLKKKNISLDFLK